MIIGINGPAGSGKSTVAQALADVHGFKRLAFADPVKQIALDFGWDGEKDEKGRKLLQVIGTECGRAYNKSIWLDKMSSKIRENIRLKQRDMVIDDVRFDNEAELIKRFGGINIKLTGASYYEKTLWGKIKKFFGLIHASEKGITDEFIDYEIRFADYGHDIEALRSDFLRVFNDIVTRETLKIAREMNDYM